MNNVEQFAALVNTGVGREFNVLDEEQRICDGSPYIIELSEGIIDNDDNPANEMIYQGLITGAYTAEEIHRHNVGVK